MKKYMKLLIAFMLIFALFVSCGSPSKTTEAQPSASAQEPEQSKTLHILLAQRPSYNAAYGKSKIMGVVGNEIKTLANRFTKAGLGDIIIDTVSYGSVSDSTVPETSDDSYGQSIYDAVYTYYQALKKAGNAPDIVVFLPYGEEVLNSESYLSSVYTEWYKYISNGDLADLSQYMEEDSGYKREDYVGEVMDGGIADGQQLFIPIMYQMNFNCGIEEESQKNGAPYPGSFTSFSEFWQQVGHAGEYADANGITLFATGPWNESSRRYGLCEQLYTDEVMINTAERAINRDNTAFRTMLRTAFGTNGYFGRVQGADKNFYFDTMYINDGKACMSMSYDLARMREYFKLTQGLLSKTANKSDESIAAYMRALPSYEDINKHTAQITLAMGVSETCQNKKLAYDFIKYCLDDDLMSANLLASATSYGYNLPVKLSNLDDLIDSGVRKLADVYYCDEEKAQTDAETLRIEVTSISRAEPYYQPLNRIFYRRFKETYNNNPDHTNPDALIDEMCDAIDQDLQTFFAN